MGFLENEVLCFPHILSGFGVADTDAARTLGLHLTVVC